MHQEMFFSREVSDLAFILRVLEEAESETVPPLELVRFLALTEMLLDEFYRYRVAELRAGIRSDPDRIGPFQLNPREELENVDLFFNRILLQQVRCWRGIETVLNANGIEILHAENLNAWDKKHIKQVIAKSLLSEINPILLGPRDAFPFVQSGEIMLFLEFEDNPDEPFNRALIPLPTHIPRFIRLKGTESRFVLLESVFSELFKQIFPTQRVAAQGLFRVIREGDLKMSQDRDDQPSLVLEALENRKKSDCIRLKINDAMPENMLRFLANEFGLLETIRLTEPTSQTRDIIESELIDVDGLLGLADSLQLVEDLQSGDRPELFFPEFIPRDPPALRSNGPGIFSKVRKRDILVHTPFDSFDIILRLMEEAATDEAVQSIRSTIYRVGKNSPFIEKLAAAARAGKKVTVVVELEARDDERDNLSIAENLRAAGVKVHFGFLDMKVHAKAIEIIRQVGGKRETFMVLGTGNFHVGTAISYTDIFLISADPDLATDVAKLFDYISGGPPPKTLGEISLAPLTLREDLTTLIKNEAKLAREGNPSSIILKMNKLADRGLIEELYAASAAGVKITLIVRGICCLRPGIKGLSENIEVRSVVGRFLEHSRIFCFSNGCDLGHEEARMFISSADLMTHKIDHRVEIMVPIKAPYIKQQILENIIKPYLNDQAQTWLLQSDGSYYRENKGQRLNIHEALLAQNKGG